MAGVGKRAGKSFTGVELANTSSTAANSASETPSSLPLLLLPSPSPSAPTPDDEEEEEEEEESGCKGKR
jgi:hypothetical protein